MLFFTHCSKTKDDSLKGTNIKVPPCKLYQAPFVQNFCKKCQSLGVPFAIFSDLHGFVFPTQEIEWYKKSPNEVLLDEDEKERLFETALATLKEFKVAYFYHLPDSIRPLHRLYRQLIQDMRKNSVDIKEITDVSEIDNIVKKHGLSPTTT